jgi:predicted DNA-binding transcriptional regulator AlpA
METIQPGITGRRSPTTTKRRPSNQTARGPPEPTPAPAPTANASKEKKRKLLGIRAVMDRYSSSDRTIDRWVADPKLGFPKPLRIRRRRFWQEAALDEFDESRADA